MSMVLVQHVTRALGLVYSTGKKWFIVPSCCDSHIFTVTVSNHILIEFYSSVPQTCPQSSVWATHEGVDLTGIRSGLIISTRDWRSRYSGVEDSSLM